MSDPVKVLVLATIIVPGDEAAATTEEIEAHVADLLVGGGFFASRVDAEFVEVGAEDVQVARETGR